MHKKYCPKCEQSKPLTEFNKNKSKKGGVQPYCRACQRTFNRNNYQKDKVRQAARVKKNRDNSRQRAYDFLYSYYNHDPKCEKCGESDLRCLQFHHLDPTQKEIQVSDLCYQGYGIERIKQELDKCILVCANCHCKIHNKTRWCNGNIALS